MQDIRNVVADEFSAVNEVILEQLESRVDLVENIGHYIVDAGGKRLRPLLSLLSASCLGRISDHQIKLAAVVEFIHTATLLHDDVVDLSSLRRGRPTANAEFGDAPSVLVGDFLYSRAFQMLVDIGDLGLMKLLADTTNIVAEGEVLQLVRAGDASTTQEQYFQVITNKTAVLFAAACSGSALLAGTHEDSLYQYGLNLGIAFQIADDVLDYTGDADEMGKNVGDDLSEGKPTLPLILVMEQGGKDADLVRNAITTKSADALDNVVAAVKRADALTQSIDVAKRYADLAAAALEPLPPSPAREAMRDLAYLSVSRNA